jgi:hypothetical protein
MKVVVGGCLSGSYGYKHQPLSGPIGKAPDFIGEIGVPPLWDVPGTR